MTAFSDPVVFQQTATFQGAVSFAGGLTVPSNAISNASVIAGAEISAAKLQHRHSIEYSQNDGADVVSATKLLYLARAAGTVHQIRVRPTTAPTGGDKQFTVDVQKAANGSGAWTSLLTTPIVMSSADVNNTLEAGTLIATPTYNANDAIRVVVVASGSTGSQGQGFLVEIQTDEAGT